MEWYNGSVHDALTEFQDKKGMLIVYIFAENDENSTKFGELLNSLNISLFGEIAYIAIRMVKGSEGANQFAQFFPTITVPVCYILGLNAQPLEVITGLSELNIEHLNQGFERALSLFKRQLSESEKSEISHGNTTNEQKGDNHKGEVAATTGEVLESALGSSSTSKEKLERYRMLIEEKKKADAKKEEDEKREKEAQRRVDGKAMSEMREKQREREMIESAEERRRQKAEDALTLKRLRDQIKADKEERAAKKEEIGMSADFENKKTSKTALPQFEANKPVNSDECRIQCRFPDGSTLNLTFPSKEPLRVVHDAVSQDARKPENFFLVQTYPRKKLTDLDKTLLDHGLTPSSVLLVITEVKKGGNGRSVPMLPAGGFGYLGMLLGILYLPFSIIWNFFYSFTNSIGYKQQSRNNGKEITKEKKGQNAKDGNIRRFTEDNSDHSDDEATWNGNSTQQL